MLENLTLSITAFRALPKYFIQEAGTLCATLLLGLHPELKLDTIQDLFTDRRPGHSFVTNPANGLHHCYFQLAQAAAGDAQHGLMCQEAWKGEAVHQYLQHQEQLLEHITGILITAGGQMPRLKELIGVEYTNSPCTERAFYVHQAEIVYVIRHSKSKRYTGHEFHVAHFLPASAGQILFLYLVYIRPFAELLFREQQRTRVQPGPGNQLLFWSCLQGQAWTTARFHRLLTAATQKVWGQPVNPRQYRQLSIGITEKHGGHLEDAVTWSLRAAAHGQQPEVVRPFQIAAKAGYPEVVQVLHEAVEKGDIEVVPFLLKCGAVLTRHQKIKIVNSASCIKKGEFGGRTALQTAVEEAVSKIFSLCLVTVTILTLLLLRPVEELHFKQQREKGNTELVQLLLSSGADVNALPARVYGMTALQAAAKGGNPDVVRLLIDYGADVNSPPAAMGGKIARLCGVATGPAHLWFGK